MCEQQLYDLWLIAMRRRDQAFLRYGRIELPRGLDHFLDRRGRGEAVNHFRDRRLVRFRFSARGHEQFRDSAALRAGQRRPAEFIDLIGIDARGQQQLRRARVTGIEKQVLLVVADHRRVEPLVEHPLDHVRAAPAGDVGENAHVALEELCVHVRAVGLQERRDRDRFREAERRVIPAGMLGLVDLCAALQQQPHRFEAALPRRQGQRRVPAFLGDTIHVQASVEQPAHRLNVALAGRRDEFFVLPALLAHPGGAPREPLRHRRIAGATFGFEPRRIEPARQHRVDEILAAIADQLVEQRIVRLPILARVCLAQFAQQDGERRQFSAARQPVEELLRGRFIEGAPLLVRLQDDSHDPRRIARARCGEDGFLDLRTWSWRRWLSGVGNRWNQEQEEDRVVCFHMENGRTVPKKHPTCILINRFVKTLLRSSPSPHWFT